MEPAIAKVMENTSQKNLTFGEVVKLRRLSKKKSQAALGRKCRVSRSYIEGVEAGELFRLNHTTVTRIVNFLGGYFPPHTYKSKRFNKGESLCL